MRKALSILLALLVISMISSNAYATPPVSDESQLSTEITSLRDAYTKVYQLDNGRTEYEIYPTKIHYKDSRGIWQDIDTTIHNTNEELTLHGYKYENGANDWIARFADQKSSQEMVNVLFEDKVLAFSIVSDNKKSELKKTSDIVKGTSLIHDELRNDSSAVLYCNVSENVDLSYQIGEDYIKENIIINSKPKDSEYVFNLNMTGLIPEQRDDIIYFINEVTGKVIFQTGPLCTEDVKGRYSDKTQIQIIKNKDKFQIKITPDKIFLNDPDTQYPVIIDPTIYIVQGSSTTYDSFVGSLEPDRNFNSGTNLPYVRTGYDTSYGIRRTYTKFTLPSISGSVVHAYTKINKYSQGSVNPSIHAYRVTGSWSSSSITWNNKPSYSTTYGSATASSLGNNWYRMDVTDIVARWYNGTYTNYGFCIRDDVENNSNAWTTWRSSDNSGVLSRPRLVIITSHYPNAICVGRDMRPDDLDFEAGAYYAWNFLFNHNYDADQLTSTSAFTVRSLLDENACVLVHGHGYGGGIQVYDSAGTTTTLTANNDGNSTHASLEYYFSDGSSTMDGIRLIVYLGCHTGQTSDMSGNFLVRSKEYGADCAIGFIDEILMGDSWSGTWSIYFWGRLCSGYSVSESLSYAAEAVWNDNWPNSYGGYNTYVYDGAVNYPAGVTIYPSQYGN